LESSAWNESDLISPSTITYDYCIDRILEYEESNSRLYHAYKTFKIKLKEAKDAETK
jgi:hypothetical protein